MKIYQRDCEFFVKKDTVLWWRVMDSNHRRHKPADLQSAPFGHFGNSPLGSFRSDSQNMELAMGLEPATTGLQNRCSTN